MAKLVGYRTVLVNWVLAIVGILRARGGAMPDDGTVATIINAVLDTVFSVPGAGIINILLRVLTSTPIFKKS